MNTGDLQRGRAGAGRLAEPDLSVVDCSGITLGNADIEASSVWTGLPDPRPTPLPIYPGGVDVLERDQ